MLVSSKNYWTKLLPLCIKKANIIPQEFYYMITPYKSLQKYITQEVIEEFIELSLYDLIDEIIYSKNLKDYKNNYYITTSENTNEIEEIIKLFFTVNYINDDFIELKKL